jgi:Protein of unknown function (DUF2442)
MIKLLSAVYLQDFQIELTFSDGLQGVFDLSAYLRSHRGPLLNALSDEGYARQCSVETGALSWSNGLELSPRRLHDLCLLSGAA